MTFCRFVRRYATSKIVCGVDIDNQLLVKKSTAIEKFKKKSVQVAVLGVDSETGEVLSLLLKQNPLISHLYLHGKTACVMAADLNQMDTRTMVFGYGERDADKAVRRAEIVLLLGLDKNTDELIRLENKFMCERDRLINLAGICTVFSPRAVTCVCVEPLSVTVPLVAEIFRKTDWYHPGRVVGPITFLQSKVNSLLAKKSNLDPAGVHVPIVGGPDLDTMVPLFSRATPVPALALEQQSLIKLAKDIPESEPVTMTHEKLKFGFTSTPTAFALNNFVTVLALGLLGDEKANVTAFIRSNIISTTKHLVSTLKVGQGGVIHNYGIPRLTKLELQLFERAMLLLNEREQMALKALQEVEEAMNSKNKSMKFNC